MNTRAITRSHLLFRSRSGDRAARRRRQFFHPQPGTSAADHLVSGLVPLALLALAGWGFPRVRPGAPATSRWAACSRPS